MLDNFEKLWARENSGRWWDNPWWVDQQYQAEFHLQRAQVETAFNALREVFDVNWAKEPGARRHPIFSDLFSASGLSPFVFLYRLGTSLRKLQEMDLLGDLPRRLRGIDEFEGACAEALVLEQWVEAGVKVERGAPSKKGNKRGDWKVSDGEAVIYGEVKRIWPARKNSERSDLGEFILGNVLERMGAAGVQGEVLFELLIRPESLSEVWQFKRLAQDIADKVMKHFEANRMAQSTGWQIVEGLARYRYVPGVEPEGLHGSFGGIPYNMRDEGDKMMEVVEEAATQLPSPGPGIVMISGSGRAAALPFADEIGQRIVDRFRMAGDSCSHIAGVLVVRNYLVPGHGLTQSAIFAKNPVGAALDTALLKRGFPSLSIWIDQR